MTFAEAYHPLRAFERTVVLMKRAPVALFAGGLLLLVFDGGVKVGVRLVERGFDWEGVDRRWVTLYIVGANVLWILGVLAACLFRIGFARAVELAHDPGEDRPGELLRGRGRWLSMVGVSLVLGAAYAAAVMLLTLMIAGGWLDLLTFAAWAAVVLYVALGLSLTKKAVAFEGLGPIAALRRSWSLVRGNRLRLLLFYGTVGVAGLSGLLLCGVGILFTGPVAHTADYDAYHQLVRGDE